MTKMVDQLRSSTLQFCPLVTMAVFAMISLSSLLVGQSAVAVTIQGKVTVGGEPVNEASVRLVPNGQVGERETKTDAAGHYAFAGLTAGRYVVSAEKGAARSQPVSVAVSSDLQEQRVDLVLGNDPGNKGLYAMEFADKANFTVAGVVDWTAVGGHGSDTSLRTSEALTRETVALKPDGTRGHGVSTMDKGAESQLIAALTAAPGSFEANHRLGEFYLNAGKYREAILPLENACKIDATNQKNEYDLALAREGIGDLVEAQKHVQRLLKQKESAELHRIAGEIDEKLNDPLAAVREYEQAARMDPSEENYFAWGSELLLHRAVWQAQEVLGRAAQVYPKSSRLLTALGTALFAGARYDEAAQRLCEASDLKPADAEPYIFMGKVEMAAPEPLACIEPRLARFAQDQPDNPLANYFYGMSIWKRQQLPPDAEAMKKVEALLTKAKAVDPKCSEAYLQLGILHSSEHDFERAIGFYEHAIEVDPRLGEAHYRLGMAYDRIGDATKAKREFALHEEIEKADAAEVERQRREVKQFLVVLGGKASVPPGY